MKYSISPRGVRDFIRYIKIRVYIKKKVYIHAIYNHFATLNISEIEYILKESIVLFNMKESLLLLS